MLLNSLSRVPFEAVLLLSYWSCFLLGFFFAASSSYSRITSLPPGEEMRFFCCPEWLFLFLVFYHLPQKFACYICQALYHPSPCVCNWVWCWVICWAVSWATDNNLHKAQKNSARQQDINGFRQWCCFSSLHSCSRKMIISDQEVVVLLSVWTPDQLLPPNSMF